MADFVGADGNNRERSDSRNGHRRPADKCDFPRVIGLSLAGYCDHRRKCSRCGSRRAIKDWRSRQLTTLFGLVQVEAPRFDACRCGIASRRIVSPLAEIMPDRCMPEYERILSKMGSLAAYGRAVALMAEFLPLGRTPAIETARRRTLRVGAKLERQILAAKSLMAPPSAQSIAVSVDGGHVKSIRTYQMRSFEVMLACASNDQGSSSFSAASRSRRIGSVNSSTRSCVTWAQHIRQLPNRAPAHQARGQDQPPEFHPRSGRSAKDRAPANSEGLRETGFGS